MCRTERQGVWISNWYTPIHSIKVSVVSHKYMFICSWHASVSHYNNIVQVGLYLQTGRLSVVLQEAGAALWQSLGALQFSWKWDTYAHNRHDRRHWLLCPKWREIKWSARKPQQQSWTDGQMFVLVLMEKKTVFTQSRTESGPSQLTRGIQNTGSQEGTLRR